ncbi:MAG: DUF4097 family beta strand repeat-containing protein [Acidobacteriota bacterium]
MRKRLGFIIFMLAMTMSVYAETFHEKFDRTVDLAPGSRLSIANVNGGVVVRTWNRPQVRIEADKSISGAFDADGVKKRLEAIVIEVKSSQNGLAVRTVAPEAGNSLIQWIAGSGTEYNVKYVLTIPERMDLNLQTVNGGMDVDGVSGMLQIETTNGGITVRNAAGMVNAETTNGSIRVQLPRPSADSSMSFETTNGAVSVELPASYRGNIKLRTTNGSIRSDLPVATSRAGKNYMDGSINGGGPTLKIQTTNGSIAIVRSGS